jgi:hypothetical protein
VRALREVLRSNLFGELERIEMGFGGIDIKTGGRYSASLELAGGGISDTGIGMDEEALNRIFHRYYRAHPEREGSGLGLLIARGMVRLHAGDIRVAARVGMRMISTPHSAGAYSGHREHQDGRIVNTESTIAVGAKRRAVRVLGDDFIVPSRTGKSRPCNCEKRPGDDTEVWRGARTPSQTPRPSSNNPGHVLVVPNAHFVIVASIRGEASAARTGLRLRRKLAKV